MFAYHLELALRSFRRSKVLTSLMVLAIALGIGSSMTTLTVYYVLSGDPVPSRSAALYYPQLDSGGAQGFVPGGEPSNQLTGFDGEALLAARRADRQALMSAGAVTVRPELTALAPFYASARYTTADFFPMFDVPFKFGRAWSADEDIRRARVVVIGSELNERLFGGENSVGRSIRLGRNEFQIVGILDRWDIPIRFYDLAHVERLGGAEETFIPYSTAMDLALLGTGSIDCWATSAGDPRAPDAPCTWTQLWVQLDSSQAAADYLAYLERYSDSQRAAGRFERPTNVRLRSLTEWLDFNGAVPGDVQLRTWLAFGFLLVCMLNTVGLLLAKFMRRGGEIGVRRALGAARGEIFVQHVVEAGVVGLAGGVLGLGLALAGLWVVRQQPTGYAELARLDAVLLTTTLMLAVIATLLAGLLPAVRACQISPSLQLKSQ